MPDDVFFRDRLILHPAQGTLDFVHDAHVILANAGAAAAYRDAAGMHRIAFAGNTVSYRTSPDQVTISLADGTLELVWNVRLAERGQTYFRLEVVNLSHAPIQLDDLSVLSLDASQGAQVNIGAPAAEWRMFQNGWQSWSAAFVRAAGDGVYADPATEEYRVKHQPHPLPVSPKTIASEWFSVITARPHGSRETGEVAILLGFVTTADQLSEVRLRIEPDGWSRLEATAFADGRRLDPGERLSSEQLLLDCDSDPLRLLDTYAMALGETMHARIPSTPLTGWCTWYYFYGQNSERDVVANIERIRAERLPLNVLILDDGYQTSDGDWTSVNEEKFPRGLKWLAGEIKRAGLVPALWVAPFAANENSRLAREHPEFLLRDADGAPVFSWQHWNERCYSLDLTREDVQEWLRHLFRTLSEDWGFEFFKLDFVYTGAAPGIHADPRATRAQAFRRGLEIIRETVGERTLLGCGAPLGPSVGLVDALRIGPDVAVNWGPFFQGDLTSPSTAYAMRNTVVRAFMHSRLWQNDPDCVLVRRRDDESSLVLNEMRTMVSLMGLSGGAIFSSDNLPSIRKGRLKYLRQVLPPSGQAAAALDLFENELPGMFVLPVKTDWGEWTVAGLINWEDRTRQTEVDMAELGLDSGREYHVYNYWQQRYLGIARGHIKVARHQPHETRVLLFKPVSNQCELLATTFHITQGLVEVKRVDRKTSEDGKSEAVCVELEKQGRQQGEVLFALPEGRRAVSARVNGRKSPFRRMRDRIIVVGLELDERARVEIESRAS